MLTQQEMTDKLKSLGLKKQFFPYTEPEAGALLLKTRKPPTIVDGLLVGSEIDLYDSDTFRVWTPQKKKAKAAAARYGLRLRLMDGECELFIPGHLADELLPKFGARVKRPLSEAAMAHLKAIGFKKHAQETSCKPLSCKNGS